MIKTVSTVLLFLVANLLLASTAAASNNKGSLFSCGMKMGGNEMVYQPASVAKRSSSPNKVRRSNRSQPEVFKTSVSTTSYTSLNLVDDRLPQIVPVARFGCSWR